MNGNHLNRENLVFEVPFKPPLPERFTTTVHSAFKHILQLDRIEKVYKQASERQDEAAFIDKVLQALDVDCRVAPSDLSRIPLKGSVVVVANHPFGLIEGIALARTLRMVRPDVKIMANFLLDQVAEARDLLISVDPFGKPDSPRNNIKGLRETLNWVRSGHVLGVFPAGEVAHIDLRTREVADPRWSETIARIIRLTEADVLPVFFDGANGPIFQLLGLLHPALRTAMLPHELLNKRGKVLEVRIGNVIPFSSLSGHETDSGMIAYLRWRTHILRHRQSWGGILAGDDGGAASRKHQPLAERIRNARKPAVEPIAPPQRAGLILHEVKGLPADQLLIRSGEFEVFYASAAQAPRLLREIGRLREIAFRGAGEGTGRAFDLDRFDLHYDHLVLWNADRSEIAGAYRIARADAIVERLGKKGLYTTTLFEYELGLLDRLGPALELGRAFVAPEYQKAVAPLALLWKGIARYVLRHLRYRVLFGTVSISNNYNSMSKRLMVEFLRSHCYIDHLASMVRPKTPFESRGLGKTGEESRALVKNIEDLAAIVSDIEASQRSIPILLKQYLKLGGRLIGFNLDHGFGDSLDGFMIVDLAETDRRMLERYMGREGVEEFLSYHSNQAAVCA